MEMEQHPALEAFPKAARDFCTAVESVRQLSRDELLVQLADSLARLYAVAVQLPAIEPVTTDIAASNDKIECRTDFWPILREKLGPLDTYWTLFDSTEKSEPLKTALSQDLSEIYEDLKQNLRLKENATALDDVYWQWRFDFHTHWGRHAVHALGALYERIRQET